jgi:hypothetical protein
MDASAALEDVLDRQYEDYRSMYQMGLEQRSCIAGEDLAGLDASLGRMHPLMDRIRLRQAQCDALFPRGGVPDAVARKREALRLIVVELQELRRVNERAVRRLLERTREELRQVQQGRRAVRGYRQRPSEPARFYDGTR